MNEEQIKQIADTVEKAIPEAVSAVVDAKMQELSEKSAWEMDQIKQELKNLALAWKQTKETKEFTNKTIVVNIIKDVVKNNISNEDAFKSIVDKHVKAMTEGTATEWAELVFDQFETDVLKVLNTYDIVNDVRIVPIAKGDPLKRPKVTNGVTTAYVAEWSATSESKPTTAFVTFNIVQINSLVSMSQELMDDTMTIPDLYNLIVEFIGESQAEFLEKEILTGATSGKIEGILVNSSVNTVQLAATETSADVSASHIISMITAAKKKYKRNSAKVKWYMSQYFYGVLRKLKTSDGYPLYPELKEMKLEWKDVVLSDEWFAQDSSEDIANAYLALYGDLSYFVMARRSWLVIESWFYGNGWANDVISLKARQRMTGKCTFPEALAVLKNGASS